MSQGYGEAPSFSIMDVLRGMRKRKLLMLTSLTLGLLMGLAVIMLIKPRYQAEARVLIDNFSTPYDSANVTQTDRVDTQITERTIASQVAVLQSEDLAQRVIKNLGLSSKAEFDSAKNGIGKVKQFLISAGFSDDPRLMTVEQRAFKEINESLTVYPLPLSNVIGIKYTAGDGAIASDVANSLAEIYVLSTREARSGDTDRASQWLSSQIEGLRQKVAESDAAVEKYRADAGLLKGQTSTLGAQEISELNTQITLAEAASSEARAKADEIRELLETQGTVEASSEVLASPIIQRLREQQLSAERRLTELSTTYLPNHPKMQAADKDIADIERRINRETLKVVDGLQGQAKIAAARATALRKSLEGLKGREGTSLQSEVKLKQLERESKANRDQLETMLARFADSNTRQNLQLLPGFARVIQTATQPAIPYFPKPGPMMLLSSLAGLGIGIGLAFLLEIMSQATRMNQVASGHVSAPPRSRHPAREAVDDKFAIPEFAVPTVQAPVLPVVEKPKPTVVHTATTAVVLARIPQARTALEARSLLNSLAPGGAAHDILVQLSHQLQAMRSQGNLKACAIASVGGACEVATLSLALARNFADNGIKTILVDLEAQGNLLPDLMELPHAPGLTDLLGGSSDFNRAIQRDSFSKLQFIRHGQSNGSTELQLPARMETITNTLVGIYDVVLVHTGNAAPAMLQLARGCSTVLLHAPAARRNDAVAAMGTLKSKGFEQVFLIQVDDLQKAAA
jgi:polysaccharide biosynthesis transport protein